MSEKDLNKKCMGEINQLLAESRNEHSQTNALDLLDRTSEFMFAVHEVINKYELPTVLIVGALQGIISIKYQEQFELAKTFSKR